MARTYEKRGTTMSLDEMHKQQNVGALQHAVAGTRWSVSETASEFGSVKVQNRNLALALLRESGKDAPTATEISSQMRSIQRWKNHENGVTGKQNRAPSPAARRAMDTVGRFRKMAKDGFKLQLRGEVAVQGYRRDRTATVDLQGDEAMHFLQEPNYGDLGNAYLGDSDSLYAFGDGLDVEIIT